MKELNSRPSEVLRESVGIANRPCEAKATPRIDATILSRGCTHRCFCTQAPASRMLPRVDRYEQWHNMAILVVWEVVQRNIFHLHPLQHISFPPLRKVMQSGNRGLLSIGLIHGESNDNIPHLQCAGTLVWSSSSLRLAALLPSMLQDAAVCN